MNWPARQQRVLHRIERRLLSEDLRLGSLFAVFTRLASDDAMPPTERVEAGPGRPLRAAFPVIAVLAPVQLPGYPPDYRCISHIG